MLRLRITAFATALLLAAGIWSSTTSVAPFGGGRGAYVSRGADRAVMVGTMRSTGRQELLVRHHATERLLSTERRLASTNAAGWFRPRLALPIDALPTHWGAVHLSI